MNYKSYLVECGKRLLYSGLTIETWGNISVRDNETGLIYLTPSGMPYDILNQEDIVVMNSKMEVVDGFRKPTIEKELHIGILNRRPDINAVIHTHPIYSQVFATMREDIPPIIDEAAQLLGGAVRCAEYALPGSHELAVNVINALGSDAACLMANHGAVCVGKDMDHAFKVCAVLEMTSQIYQLARSIGTVQMLKEDDIKAMKEFAANYYGQR